MIHLFIVAAAADALFSANSLVFQMHSFAANESLYRNGMNFEVPRNKFQNKLS